jgi:predicted choloylglycine hydrolase
MELVFEAVSEEAPGARWQALFRARWPAYKAWYLSEGITARPTYLQCRTALRRHMPELMPVYERLCALAGGSDLSARFLSFYRPPPYISGCSQAVWRGGEPVLVRNYDYDPRLCDGLILDTAWAGGGVIASIDCLWGCLDGMNEAGLAVSLSFGGRRAVGDGFGIPIVLRYVLEFCRTAADAADVLRRVPTHMAYNVTAIDRTGAFFTAQLAPDRPALISKARLATNHQGEIEWQRHADATASVERERFLARLLSKRGTSAPQLADAFLRPPLHSKAYARGYGTLYTAIYRPARGEVEYRWPEASWTFSFAAFGQGVRRIHLLSEAAQPTAAVTSSGPDP